MVLIKAKADCSIWKITLFGWALRSNLCMFYQEYLPHPNLTNFIKCYWLWKISSSTPHYEGATVLTEGFEFSFNLADPLEVLTHDRKFTVGNGSSVIAPMTQPIRIRPTGKMKVFGICFMSCMFVPLLLLNVRVCAPPARARFGQVDR